MTICMPSYNRGHLALQHIEHAFGCGYDCVVSVDGSGERNGAIYIATVEHFEQYGFGLAYLYGMDVNIDIDTEDDLKEALSWQAGQQQAQVSATS